MADATTPDPETSEESSATTPDRETFEALSNLAIFILVVFALAVLVTIVVVAFNSVWPNAVPDSSQKPKEGSGARDSSQNVETGESLFKILAIAIGGIWFVVRVVYRRQEDSAVEFTARATTLTEPNNRISLEAQLKNVTFIAAGIKELTWVIIDVTTENKPTEGGKPPTVCEKEYLNGKWSLLPQKSAVLTRNSSWQLVHIIVAPPHGAYKLKAVCQIGLQPDEQAILHESAFVVNAPKPEERSLFW